MQKILHLAAKWIALIMTFRIFRSRKRPSWKTGKSLLRPTWWWCSRKPGDTRDASCMFLSVYVSTSPVAAFSTVLQTPCWQIKFSMEMEWNKPRRINQNIVCQINFFFWKRDCFPELCKLLILWTNESYCHSVFEFLNFEIMFTT